MPDINDGQILRFEQGGEIIITPGGGAELTVLNVIEGTLRFTPGVRQTFAPDTDRGTLLTRVRKGNQQPATLDFDVKYTSDIDATDLFALLADDGDAADLHYLPNFNIEVRVFTAADKSAWHALTLTDAVRAEAPSISAGAEMDTLAARWLATGWSRASGNNMSLNAPENSESQGGLAAVSDARKPATALPVSHGGEVS